VTNNLDTLLTALYVFCDDHVTGRRRIGRPPLLSDAELLCLAIAQVLLDFPRERHWIRYARKHLRHLFPYIPGQSGYGKRLRAAGPLIAKVIRKLAEVTETSTPILMLIDSTPVPCGMSRETVKRSDLAGDAGYGYCASHSRYFWGMRLEQHGARQRHGLYARVGQRLLAMAACIWHNTNIDAPSKRSLIAYDH